LASTDAMPAPSLCEAFVPDFSCAKLARHWNFNKLQDAPKGNR